VRKLVVATNVAETSVTIDGVTAVVDAGLAKLMDHDAATGAPLYIFEYLVGENIHRYPMSLTRLECQVSELVDSDACPRPTTGLASLRGHRVSRAAAVQRAGRAGRTRPGRCYHLFLRAEEDRMAPETPPEVLRAPLPPLLLLALAGRPGKKGVRLSLVDPLFHTKFD
jgi:HrpA-like RNA helicase